LGRRKDHARKDLVKENPVVPADLQPVDLILIRESKKVSESLRRIIALRRHLKERPLSDISAHAF
jgi:hypothetical protein